MIKTVRGNSSGCIKGIVRFSYGRGGVVWVVWVHRLDVAVAVRKYGIVLNGAGSFMELAVD